MSGAVLCPSCGHEPPADSPFCNACGQAIDRAPHPSPQPHTSHPQPASFADARYRVIRFLGEGGKKRVYLAHDTRLERDVALAIIKTQGLDDTGRARVRREARAMGRLGDHPHMVTIYDVGEEKGEPFIVSQFMGGGSVEDLLSASPEKRLPLERALRVADEICRALEHAHERGVIHRDLKPANVWLTKDGTAKLGDFGLALATDRSRLTTEGMMVGTVAYMPPEQALGRTPDARGDLYSLGALLYEMVTGRPPFLGDDAVAVISQHINTPPVAPTWHNAEVPRALEALILHLLAKAPEDRPENASAVLDALTAIAKAAATGVPAPAPDTAGEANPLDRLATGIFVGREKEMDGLRAGLEDALSGRGRVLMLVGEPGIGKTRTAQELVTYARLRKAQVLWGRCYEGEGAPAYWPWVQAIRTYVHDRDAKQLFSELGSGAAHIAQMVSEVRDRLPGLPDPPKLEPEQARFRLFDSITTFLKNAARDQPLVLVLDDLHWADKSSLLLLQFLARELQGARLLVVGTYRDVGLRRQHPLSQTLAELTREQLSERILLRGLTEHDVGRFIEITAGIKPPRALIGAVYKETEGNPFFVNEVVRLLVTDGRLEHPEQAKSWSVSIPQGVKEVIGRRLDHLSEACNRALTIASVIGREFSLDALEPVSEVKGDRLLEVLDEAIAARVVAEVPRQAGRYGFSHALIRETLYEELTTTRRVRLHRQIGGALEALYGNNPEPHLAELAYHFFEAAQGGDVKKAIAYAVRAGDRAATQMAHEAAAGHYETALQGMELRGPSGEGHRCEILLKLGEEMWRAGERDKARGLSLEAAALARELGTPEHLARAALGYGSGPGGYQDVASANQTLMDLLEEALEALPKEDSLLRAQLLARLASELYYTDSVERRAGLAREAVAMAERIGDPILRLVALSALYSTIVGPDTSPEKRLSVINEMMRLAEQIGDKEWGFRARYLRIGALFEVEDIPAARKDTEICTRLADELHMPLYRWQMAATQTGWLLLEGRYEEAERLAQRCIEIGERASPEITFAVFGAHMHFVRWGQGRLGEMEDSASVLCEEYPWIPASRCGLAFLYAEWGKEEETRAQLELLAKHDFSDFPRDGNWFLGLGVIAFAIYLLKDKKRAQAVYDLLLPYESQSILVTSSVFFGPVTAPLGALAATLEDWESAARHFETAIARNRVMGNLPIMVRCQIALAEMLVDRNGPGDRDHALTLLARTVETANELGLKGMLERIVSLRLRLQGVRVQDTRSSIDAVTIAVEQERPDLRRHAAPDGTVTIVFSDIENSTAMTEKLGDRRWMELLRDHNRIVREHLAAHGGFEVKSQGDGFMLAFQSAAGALRCAIATQRAFAAYAKDNPEESVRVRMGLHTGEAIKEADDFFGKNVILAARIAAKAKGGEVLVSSLVKNVTESAKEFTFGKPQQLILKGLSGTYEVHALAC